MLIRIAKRVIPRSTRAKMKSWLANALAGAMAENDLIARTDAMAQLLEQRLHRLELEVKKVEQGLHQLSRVIPQSKVEAAERADAVFALMEQRLEGHRQVAQRDLDGMRAEIGRGIEKVSGHLDEVLLEAKVSTEVRVAELDVRVDQIHRVSQVAYELKSRIDGLAEKCASISITAHEARAMARQTKERVHSHMDKPFSASAGEESPYSLNEADYVTFEQQFRVSDESLAARLGVYVGMSSGSEPVLDLGCGSGELLGLLKDGGVEARGVDASAAMVDKCKEKGLWASRSDATSFLRGAEPGMFKTILCVHMAEHLGFNQLCELIGEAHRILPEGGQFIIESPNVSSLLAWSRYYTIDPTHESPRHPALIRFLFQRVGFSEIELDLVHPHMASEALVTPRQVSAHEAVGANGSGVSIAEADDSLVASLSENFEKLNHLLFMGQDYRIRGIK